VDLTPGDYTMADTQTRADSLRLYLTGAGSDDGSQIDDNASLGGYRSSTEVVSLAASRASAIANITIDFVAGKNGIGAGTLTVTGDDTLTWTPPGGTVGSAVTILNGESKLIEGSDVSKWVQVTRTSATALTGTETTTLTYQLNNAVALDNVSSSEASSGDDEYRIVAIRNNNVDAAVESLKVMIGTLGTQATADTDQLAASGAGTIETTDSFADWPNSGFAHVKNAGGTTQEIVYYASRTDTVLTVPAAGRAQLGTSATAGAGTDTVDAVPGIRIAKEAPTGDSSTGSCQTIADESTAPTSVTWNTGITAATGLDIGSLASGDIYFIHIHRKITAGSSALSRIINLIDMTYDAA